MRYRYQQMPVYGDEFGQLFNQTIPFGTPPRGRNSRSGPPLGKITLDATPELTARLDRLLGVTERIATEAASTSKLAIGVAVFLGLGALGVAVYTKSGAGRYE